MGISARVAVREGWMSDFWSEGWTTRRLQSNAMWSGFLLGLIMLSTPVMAESTGEAMRAFGFVGTWAGDCAKSADTTGYWRVTYATSSNRAATSTRENR